MPWESSVGTLIFEIELVAGPARGEVVGVRLVEVAGGEAGRDRVGGLRVLLATELELGQALAVGPDRADAVEGHAPAALRRVVLVEAGDQRVPRDLRCDGVHAVVHGSEHVLDAAAVAGADHAQPRVAGRVELGLGLLDDLVDEQLRVLALELRRVRHDVAGGGAEAARVPGEDVVPGVEVARDDAVVLGRAARAVARPVHDRGCLAAGGEPVRREVVVGDLRAVERRERALARLRRCDERDHREQRRGPCQGTLHRSKATAAAWPASRLTTKGGSRRSRPSRSAGTTPRRS